MALRLPEPGGGDDTLFSRTWRGLRKGFRKAVKSCMKSHPIRVPKYDFPIRIRPWFLLFTSLIMLLLAFLGFTNFVRRLPMNDKILHFICLGIATGIFYFIWDVEEDARRIWIWRNAGTILTSIICFFFGGIVSEIIQSMLPYKEFQIGDVIANLLGSALGLWVSYHLERYYRHRREISRLYRPVAVDEEEIFSDSDSEASPRHVPLLPTHRPVKPTAPKLQNHIRLNNVWDESDELFNIGEEDDDDLPRQSNDTIRAASVKVIVTPPN